MVDRFFTADTLDMLSSPMKRIRAASALEKRRGCLSSASTTCAAACCI
jgi:hypothetical protein